MRRLYTFFFGLLVPLLLLRLFWRSLKAPVYRQRWYERLGYRLEPVQQECIWLHAVSVGEVQAVEPLIQQLLTRYPKKRVVVTTTTPTGAQRALALFGGQIRHYYAPFDLPSVTKRFLTALKPQILILVETEIWPNLVHEASAQGVPILLANARLSARSAKGYRKVLGLTRETLQKITLIAPHAEEDAQRFLALGARAQNVEVTGSIKFDIRLSASQREESEVLRRQWGGGRSVWLAASTHEGEEGPILEAHARLREQLPEALLVLVPRHPERFDQVAELVESQGFNLQRRSAGGVCKPDTAVYLGDTMGELPLFFGAVDLAFIGGSLVPVGGHNLLEAAVHGVPVVFGPHMFNFADIVRLFLKNRGAVQVENIDELAGLLMEWLSDASARSQVGETGRKLVECNRGALQKLLDQIKRLLERSGT